MVNRKAAGRRSSYVPDRGDIVFLEFDPQAGHEQRGHRPALVLSPKAYNGKAGLALMCPVTSAGKGYPFEVPLPTGCKITGVVLSDQIKSLDWQERKAKFCAKAGLEVLVQTLARIDALLK